MVPGGAPSRHVRGQCFPVRGMVVRRSSVTCLAIVWRVRLNGCKEAPQVLGLDIISYVLGMYSVSVRVI